MDALESSRIPSAVDTLLHSSLTLGAGDCNIFYNYTHIITHNLKNHEQSLSI